MVQTSPSPNKPLPASQKIRSSAIAPKPSHRAFPKAILGVSMTCVFVVLVAVGAFVAGRNSMVVQAPVAVLHAPETVLTSPMAIPEGQLEGWKIYTNNQHGFSVRYPQDWILEVNEGKPIRIKNNENLTPNDLEKLHVSFISSELPESEFVIALYPSQGLVDREHLQQFVQSTDTLTINHRVETEIEGHLAIQYQATGIGLDERGISGIVILTKSGYLHITSHNYLGDTRNQELLDQILSTLQFLN